MVKLAWPSPFISAVFLSHRFMPIDAQKSKRRRYLRYAIELKATVLSGLVDSYPGTILDFCAGGLFLEVAAPLALHQALKIRFAMDSEIGGDRFEIEARVVRIQDSGVAVATEQMSTGVLSALTKQATARFEITADGRAPANHQEKSKRRLKQWLLGRLPNLFDAYFECLNAKLSQLNQHFAYFANQSLLDDLVTDILQHRERIISEFCYSVIAQLEAIIPGEQEKEFVCRDDMPLSLVDQLDFDDWLTLSALIRRLNNHFEEPLNQIAWELSRIFGLSRAAIGNPIRPAVLCESFRELVLQFGLENQPKEALYRVFEGVLCENLGALYQQLHIFLLAQEPEGHGAAKPQPAHIRHSVSHQDARLHAGTRQREDQPQGLESPSSIIQMSVGTVVGKLLGILNELAAATGPADQQQVLDTVPLFPGGRFAAHDIASALARLGAELEIEPSLRRDPVQLNERLRQSLEQEDTKLSAAERQQLEIYSGFFETLFTQLTEASVILPYLEKVHLPLLSLCLQGQDFLEAAEHPARKILNQLALLEPALKNQKMARNISAKNKLDLLIDRLQSDVASNPDVLVDIERELTEITQQVVKAFDLMIKRMIEAHEGEQKLEVAKRAIQNEIDQRLAGRSVPSILPMLLEAGWQQLLVIAELNRDRRPEEKEKLLAVIDDLLFWLYEQESILKIQAGSIYATIAFIAERLRPVCPDPVMRNRIVQALNASLLGVGEPRVRKPLDIVSIQALPSEAPSLSDEWTQMAEALQVGDWLTISVGTSVPEPMRLVWIGNVVGIYLFVNRDGSNRLDMDKQELARLLHSGDVRVMENLNEPLVDRAANSMLQKLHEQLLHSATHDPVTELITREELIKRLKLEISKPESAQHMLCHMEVLDFRLITNICGIEAGEQLLKRLARQTAEQLGEDDIFSRLGSKSFAILFKDCLSDEGIEKARNLVKLLADSHFQWLDKSFAVSVSIGLVPFGDSHYDVQLLLQQADSASLSAERSSPGRVLLFSDTDEHLQRLYKLHGWIGHLDEVLAQERLFLRCQKITQLIPGPVSHEHYEILLGIRDEAGGMIPPDQFIPAVERCKRMPEIDRWIITHVVAWIARHRDYFAQIDGFSINLSGQSVNSEEFLGFLIQMLTTSEIPVEKLTFEITETVASENFAFTNRFIKAIKQFGCKFSLDDFGSGYSSYSYLKHLNVDYLKIDGAFVKDILNNQADVAIVKSMNEIAHSLGLQTIAEYVENEEIAKLLHQLGVDYGQGYGLHKPEPLAGLVSTTPALPKETFFFENDNFWDL